MMESWKVQKKMLVELVLRGPDNDGDFEVEVLKRLEIRNIFVFPHREGISISKI